MLKAIVAVLLVTLISTVPHPAFAQSSSAPSAQHAQRPTGSYRSQMQKRRHQHRERARYTAEHARQRRQQ